MPYTKMSQSRIKKLNGVNLTLAQVNWIASIADRLEKDGKVDNPWAVAISQFKKSFHVEGNKWVKNKKKVENKDIVVTDLDLRGVAVDYIMKALDDYMSDNTDFDDVPEKPKQDAGAYTYKTTLSNVLEAAIHNVATEVADKLYGLGYMNRQERIELSNAIGDALEAYANADGVRSILDRTVDKFDIYDFFKERGMGKGVGGSPQGDGGADICVCPECGATSPHEKGVPCAEMKCPKCGAAMVGKNVSESTQTSTATKEKKYKVEGGRRFSASDYAYVPDPNKPSTWKLRLVETPGGPVTKAMLGRAAAAFSPGGFRGNRVQIPAEDIAKVKARIRAEYKKLDVDPKAIPPSVQKELDTSNRWIAVSTVDRKDLQGETFGVDAIDYDATRAKELNEYPDLRVFHVRGLKIGKADTMYRVGKYAVDEGYFLDDEFSQVMKDEISKNNGRWKISRGFGVIEATGLCRNCGAGLTVTPYHDIVGFTCPVCKSYHASHNSLKELRFTKTRTFDITVTDIPVVPWTSVSAYSLTNQEEVK